MARKKQKKYESERWHHSLNPETKQSIWAVLSFAFAAVFALIAFDKAGILGSKIHYVLEFVFGKALFLLPIVFALAGVSFLLAIQNHILRTTLIGGVLFLISSLGMADLIFEDKFAGYVGFLINYPLYKLFGFWASLITMGAVLTVSILIMLNAPLRLRLFGKNGVEADNEGIEDSRVEEYEEEEPELKEKASASDKKSVVDKDSEEKNGNEENDEDGANSSKKRKGIFSGAWTPSVNLKPRRLDLESQSIPLELLEGDRGKPQGGDIKANSNVIKRTLTNFGIDVEMGEVSVGPSVTQYTLRPAEGVKLSKIVALQNDLALALAAHPLRIEAPIPGRSLVGIEIPNKAIAKVGLRSLVASDEFQSSEKPLLFALGRNVSGQAVYASLAAMPHLLIAGSTGAGKSVCLHSVMMSLLYGHSPDDLKFLMIDPKRVELTTYGGIPHLLSPVIIDAKKAILALKWATQEMERRYEVLSRHKARDIHSYREKIKGDEEAESMPFIVVVIDELADIMATYPRELESAIVRLAQMSRAVGIHLIVSTQRPSVEVITGLIKANITSRIAFKVASQVDSRTVLDMSGAEKLLGSGDMLYLAGDAGKPKRIQGAFISEQEVRRVVQYLEKEYEGEGSPEEGLSFERGGSPGGDAEGGNAENKSIFDEVAWSDNDDDELYEEARVMVIEAGKASTSYLQRRLKLGYARAARLMDMLEERGIVGPADGAKPREVLVSAPNREEETGENNLSDI